MAKNLVLAKGNTAPSLVFLLARKRVAVDVTGATVTFRMRQIAATVLKVTGTCVIVSAIGGEVRYDWGANDLNTIGRYIADVLITYSTGKKETSELFYIDVVEGVDL